MSLERALELAERGRGSTYPNPIVGAVLAVFVHMGATFSKNQELEVIRSGGIVYKSVDVQDESVRFVGSTAILLTRLRLVAVVGGNEVTNPFVVTEVFVPQGGKWTLASLSFTRLLTP